MNIELKKSLIGLFYFNKLVYELMDKTTGGSREKINNWLQKK